MSLNSVSALRALFTMSPFKLLLQGTHSTVYIEPLRLRAKDDIEHHAHLLEASVSEMNQMRELLDVVLQTSDFLDIAVNGREFALTRIAVVFSEGIKGLEYIVTARHRLHKDESASFKALLLITV